MDSGCTNTTICNGELMHGLRQAEKELDMHTNVGSRVLDEEGFLGRFPPPVYYDEDGIANVLAMREMIAAGYRITMDTDFDNAFVVHCDGDRQMRFVNRRGVYVLEQLGANVEQGAKETSAMYCRQLSNAKKLFLKIRFLINIHKTRQKHQVLACSRKTVFPNISVRSKSLIMSISTTRMTWLLSLDSMFMQLGRIPTLQWNPEGRRTTRYRPSNVEAWATAEGVTFVKFFDKTRDLETFQDGNRIAGADYLEEAFDQEYEPEDEDERDFNLHGQFNDIDDSEREELLADADNDVDDMQELTVRFQGDDDYESDDSDSCDDEEEAIVADLDHHQENADRGTDDIGSLVTDLEDLQEPSEEKIVFEPETP
ncbi:unnamed protein product [Cylindrotheca closterium]|uniref:Uncharacterized protein n=1 Tax=Cylindrotheca closterium TaxID=2856 RepID=A0AAD2FHG7_9STRA|nr:unnamed protein product [Cylindrotheca closterium]